MANVKITVLPGRVVQYNRKTSYPGDILSCDEAEAVRLAEQDVVLLLPINKKKAADKPADKPSEAQS